MLSARRNGQNRSSGASLPQNRTFECEDLADFCARLKDALNAAKDALVVVERVIQKYAHQDRPAVEQVLAYPGEASADQPFMQELFDNGSVRDKSAKGEATEAAPAMRGEQQGEPRSVKKDEPRGEPQQREQSAKKVEQQGEAKFREGRAAGRAETGAPQGEPSSEKGEQQGEAALEGGSVKTSRGGVPEGKAALEVGSVKASGGVAEAALEGDSVKASRGVAPEGEAALGCGSVKTIRGVAPKGDAAPEGDSVKASRGVAEAARRRSFRMINSFLMHCSVQNACI
jgi:hypothetical protein